MEQKNDILWRMRLVYFSMVLLGLLILGKVVYIQFVEGDYWRERDRLITLRDVRVEANRGDIYADDGRLLATNIPVYEIRMDMSRKVTADEVFFANIDSLAFRLSRLFGDRSQARYKADLLQARRNQQRYYLIKRNVSHEELLQLQQFPLFRMGRFRSGLIVVQGTRRQMPYKTLAARTIGYNREGIYVGLEGAYHEYLQGIEGKQLMQRTSGNSWMPISDHNVIHPKNGKDLVTTINIQIQDITEKALLRQLHQRQALAGTAVVMEVSTGKIKAISNLLLNRSTGRYEEVYNFAVGHSSEPGSTFKLAGLMAGLEDGLFSIEDSTDTRNGRVSFYDRVMRDANNEGRGVITIREAFEVSSNVGISQVIYGAYKDQPQRFVDRLKQMHLHRPLDIEISGEGQPLIRNAGDPGWSRVSLPWMSIGYEVSLTPLQTLTLYNAVANNGIMVKPMFVSEIRQAGRTIKQFSPTVIDRRIAKPSTIDKARELLLGVVENGTAKNIHTSAYPIAGKTGTAQITQETGGYQSQGRARYQASFVGYFPANNPAYSCIVVIYEPTGWFYTGGQVAAPVFREIADKIYAARLFTPEKPPREHLIARSVPSFRNAYHEDMKTIYAELHAHLRNDVAGNYVRTIVHADTVELQEREFVENLVPEVVGMGLRDAMFVLENAGLRVRFTGRGMVRTQSIRPGTRISPGSIIYIELS